MTKGYPTYSKRAREGDKGVDVVARIFNDDFGWLFRRNHQEHDFGIDAQVDVILDGGSVTGQILAVQIKHGSSYFTEKSQWGYIYRGEQKHFNYLFNYPTPVLIIICHPTSRDCYWIEFDPSATSQAGENWKITIPFKNKLKASKTEILNLLPPPADHLSDIQSYWQMNDLLIKHDRFYILIDKGEVKSKDISRARAFFNRIRSSREIAAHCQGRVEIAFHGYNDDPRELFVINEVREYIPILIAALPEIFFFVDTGRYGLTLKTIGLCLSKKNKITGQTSDRKNLIEVSIDEICDFMESHFIGLNEMTEWMGMPEEENRRITFEVYHAFGLEPEAV